MCGIFAAYLNKPEAGYKTFEGLKKLEYRGYDSWGVALLQDDQTISVSKEIGTIGDSTLDLVGSVAIGHTRWATHGGVTKQNAHPHLSCDKKFAVIHNGIIDNYLELKSELLARGHVFESGTDTEVFAHLLEEKTFWDSFAVLDGYNAIVALDAQNGTIYAAKTGSPLVVGIGKDNTYYLASDPAALTEYTCTVCFVEDMQGVQISDNGFTLFDLSTHTPVAYSLSTLEVSDVQTTRNGYEHFLDKEINEQPEVIRLIAETSSDQIQQLTRAISRSYGTYFVACGTAYNAALAGAYLFSKIAKRHINITQASEFSYLSGFIRKESLVVALTQSGETIDVIEALKAAHNKGATIASLVNVQGSTVDRLSAVCVHLLAGPEKAVLATKSYIAKLTVLLLTAYALSENITQGQELLHTVSSEVTRLLSIEMRNQLQKIAQKIAQSPSIFLIGRGSSYADAIEGALKIKEVSYIHAEGFAGGELKHGSIALIEEKTPVIVFAPPDETYRAIISNAMEVKARGAYVIGVSNKPLEVFDEYIHVADVGVASPIANIIPIQQLAYFLALERGCDPDKPRNLAKSVTVR
ncbi:glutamine--fructose-6-phosphate transaminase (isomerizing) [candidate division WWE3 bacterium CG_4_10_14_0_2_um_filter_41_14]|uniref:Glutamine--fructose-6-phosphate aminotransferase [isomerizing] n=1 Tax=candidate division WWE3 bacterium CG_4_10_14_0_2_um_filter_41_14 TaxID=1975072 RepID=A0A2M7TJ81_UNCKA|nr:MAG: glutamine--fructose-6-phosphate transaminase (isomerizing) [candidate division WWE3 bacterium CG_4_10_14_0_2_um_filter_41_14]